MKTTGGLSLSIFLALFLFAGPVHGASDTIPPGTKITMQNWRDYQQFMPLGMAALFEGKYFWKMPPDVEMDVGETIIHPLPPNYRAATERYGSQTKIATLPDGGYKLDNYVAGQPFPNPSGPHKGWKILANLWYRYLPHLFVAADGQSAFCAQDRFHSISCQWENLVYRQLKHNTDPGVPMTDPQAGPMDFTEWVMVVRPEQNKYSAYLMISPTDLTQPFDVYIFKPDLRRSLQLSTSARCSPSFGSDLTPDDARFGFNGNISEFQAKFLGERKILALTDYNTSAGHFPDNWYMPLGFPKPSWGKWELRDVDVIDVRKIPSKAAGYCYGKRIMYIDKQFNAPLWQELYDSNMKLWKIVNLSPRAAKVSGIGIVNGSGATSEEWWDIRNNHASYAYFIADHNGHDVLTGRWIPKEYDNVAKYSTPGGLNLILR